MKHFAAPIFLALLVPIAPIAPIASALFGSDARRAAWMPGERTALVSTLERDAERTRTLAGLRAGELDGPKRLAATEREELRAASRRDAGLQDMRAGGIVTAVLVILIVVLILAIA
jgi:hypothetical protein